MSALSPAQAQTTRAQTNVPSPAVLYDVDFSRAHTQRLTVTLRFDMSGALADRDTVQLKMPAWRPGRYVILDSAGGVITLKAKDDNGEDRVARKTDKATWTIESKGARSLEVEYELYTNALSQRTRHADDSHAFLSGSAVFLYVPELRFQPLEVHFQAPDSWVVASGLERLDSTSAEPAALVAPSFDVLIDSPIEIGVHDRIDFEVAGTPHEIIIWPAGRQFDRDRLVKDFTTIIEHQRSIFGNFPYQRYVFLVHAGAGAGGGTEHLNSTIMQVPLGRLEGSLTNDKDYRSFLGLVSHEFFHTWNVKQLRPASMAPYDLQSENYSTLFWVAEGTTSYYTSLTLVRTGLIDTDKYLEGLGDLIDGSRNRPGTAVQSLSDSSYDAWVKFNRRTPDAANTTVSIYSEGALASLLLDLQIRAKSKDQHSLEEVLRSMYERYPLDQGGYRREDLETTLHEITEHSWLQFFNQYIDGVAALPLQQALLHVGLELFHKADKPRNGAKGSSKESTDEPKSKNTNSDKKTKKAPQVVAHTGAKLRSVEGRAEIRSLRAGSAFYRAGLLAGDELIAVDGRRVDADHWDDLVASFEPGQRVTVHFVRHGNLRTLDLELGERLAATWKVQHVENPTDQQKVSYEKWIAQAWPDEKDDEDGAGQEDE